MTSHDRTTKLSLSVFFAIGLGVTGCFGASSEAIGIDPISGEPIGHGARCTAVSECGGETPLCSGGFCVECVSPTDCPGSDICTGRGFCGECTQNSECSGGEDPFCDATRGRCVECTSAGDCSADEPICDPDGECRMACDASSCDQDELCHPTISTCVECSSAVDCGGDKPLCDTNTFECEECLSNSDCGAADPYCVDGECSECIQNSDCAGGLCDDDLECRSACMSDAMCMEGDRPHCDVASGDCEECNTDAQCEEADKPVCMLNECEECRTTTDCQVAGEVCIENQCESN
ncbi:MAG: hypothetical protein ACI9KE_004201 [Polyangiales bacterium]|jgi:hypothetical protein